jgi:hypothetical protein
MLGEILFEEKGKTIGVRVLSSEAGESTVEVTLQTQGRIQGMEETSLWTYWSKTRSDGSMYGEGKGFMTTKEGDVVNLIGNGAAKSRGSDGSVHYRGAIYFQTTSPKLSRLNGCTGIHEYDVDAEGNAVTRVWEWK